MTPLCDVWPQHCAVGRSVVILTRLEPLHPAAAQATVPVTINGLDGNSEYQDRIIYTLSELPAKHLRLFRHITIRDREDYAGGSTNWVSRSNHSAGLWIMIDIDSFDPRQRAINNRPPEFLHYTLLHEMGHVVEHTYHGMRYVRLHDLRVIAP